MLFRSENEQTKLENAEFKITSVADGKEYVVKTNSDGEAISTLLSLIDNGMKGKLGYENIPQYQSILNNMLLNESVYMPLIHSFLPAKFMEKTFMSEVAKWFTKLLFQDNNFNTYICAINRIQK